MIIKYIIGWKGKKQTSVQKNAKKKKKKNHFFLNKIRTTNIYHSSWFTYTIGFLPFSLIPS